MSKWQKILLGVFSVGVLLCGIGAGVIFTEFSSLAYGVIQILGEPDIRTENLDVEFEPGDEKYLITGWYQWRQDTVLTDEKVPENTVRFHVTYNSKRVIPRTYWDEENQEISLQYSWLGDDDEDMKLLMEAKDLFLKNIKEGRLVSFDTVGVEEVTVTVNPANVDDIRLIY